MSQEFRRKGVGKSALLKNIVWEESSMGGKEDGIQFLRYFELPKKPFTFGRKIL